MNVARVLHELGHEVVVTGLAGGFTGEAARAELNAAGLRDELVEIEGQSRLTLVVVDREGSATGFWEPGPVVAATGMAGGTQAVHGADRLRRRSSSSRAACPPASLPTHTHS